MFTVKYIKYDEEKKGDRFDIASYAEAQSDVHISRLYPESTEVQHEIDFVDYTEINQRLLLQREDAVAVGTWNALTDAVHEYLFLETFIMYGFVEGYSHWKGVKEFVVNEIFQFLFAPHFNFAVDCLIDGDEHRKLEMSRLKG